VEAQACTADGRMLVASLQGLAMGCRMTAKFPGTLG
jgi:hypothetical protein